MPVKVKKLPPESTTHQKLVQDLVAELKKNRPTGPGPEIIEEEQRGGWRNITVIWEAWKDVDPEERGRIIMDAYEKERPYDVPTITVALGLTKREMMRLHI